MDDHMLSRISSEIELCFTCIDKGENIEESLDYKAAAVLIEAYNSLIKLYYYPEWHYAYCKGSVEEEYKLYLENRNE